MSSITPIPAPVTPPTITAPTNEALAILARSGDREAAAALWEQTYSLIYKLLSRYFPLCTRCGIEADDLRQSGYFALLRAVEAYNPARGLTFNSYLSHHVANVAKETLGFANSRTKLPPVHLSLSEPLGEDENLTLADTLADHNAEHEHITIEREARRQDIAALRIEADQLPDRQRQAVLSTIWDGNTLKSAAVDMGCTKEAVRRLRQNGLRTLSNTKTARSIAQCHGYQRVGLTRFMSTHTSEQERYVLWLEEWDERLRGG